MKRLLTPDYLQTTDPNNFYTDYSDVSDSLSRKTIKIEGCPSTASIGSCESSGSSFGLSPTTPISTPCSSISWSYQDNGNPRISYSNGANRLFKISCSPKENEPNSFSDHDSALLGQEEDQKWAISTNDAFAAENLCRELSWPTQDDLLIDPSISPAFVTSSNGSHSNPCLGSPFTPRRDSMGYNSFTSSGLGSSKSSFCSDQDTISNTAASYFTPSSSPSGVQSSLYSFNSHVNPGLFSDHAMHSLTEQFSDETRKGAKVMNVSRDIKQTQEQHIANALDIPVSRVEPSIHLCPKCNKKFKRKEHMSRHLRIHDSDHVFCGSRIYSEEGHQICPFNALFRGYFRPDKNKDEPWCNICQNRRDNVYSHICTHLPGGCNRSPSFELELVKRAIEWQCEREALKEEEDTKDVRVQNRNLEEATIKQREKVETTKRSVERCWRQGPGKNGPNLHVPHEIMRKLGYDCSGDQCPIGDLKRLRETGDFDNKGKAIKEIYTIGRGPLCGPRHTAET